MCQLSQQKKKRSPRTPKNIPYIHVFFNSLKIIIKSMQKKKEFFIIIKALYWPLIKNIKKIGYDTFDNSLLGSHLTQMKY